MKKERHCNRSQQTKDKYNSGWQILELQIYRIVIDAVRALQFPDEKTCHQNKNSNVNPLPVPEKSSKAIKQEANNQKNKINAKNQGSHIYNFW